MNNKTKFVAQMALIKLPGSGHWLARAYCPERSYPREGQIRLFRLTAGRPCECHSKGTGNHFSGQVRHWQTCQATCRCGDSRGGFPSTK